MISHLWKLEINEAAKLPSQSYLMQEELSIEKFIIFEIFITTSTEHLAFTQKKSLDDDIYVELCHAPQISKDITHQHLYLDALVSFRKF